MVIGLLKSGLKGACGVGMGLECFGNGAPHLDEFMHHTPVNFQVHRHASGTKLVGVHHAFIDQRVALGQTQPSRGDAVNIGRAQWRKAPVVAVGRGAQVVVEEISDVSFFKHKALGKCFVRGRVLVRGATRVKEELQAKWQPTMASLNGACSSQRAASAVPTNRYAMGVQAQPGTLTGDPLHRVPRIVMGHRKLESGRQPVSYREHGTVGQAAQGAAQHIVGGQAADGEAATVKIQEHRQSFTGWRIESHGDVTAIARLKSKTLNPVYLGWGKVQYASAHLVSSPGLHGREGV